MTDKIVERYEQLIQQCIHCALCLSACPTFRVTGFESESPRGRIYLMRNYLENRMSLDKIYSSIDLCLDCLACQEVCPSNVRYGELLELSRWFIKKEGIEKTDFNQLMKRLVLLVLPNLRYVKAGYKMVYVYQKSGLIKVVNRLLPEKYRVLNSLIPHAIKSKGMKIPESARIALLEGCIQGSVYKRVNDSTINVFRAAGVNVTIPHGQRCCGALHAHYGELEKAKEMAMHNIQILEKYDYIITNSAGCGLFIKEYAKLLEDTEYKERALKFSKKVKDVSELLINYKDKLDLESTGEVVTYQDPCHLAHGQKIRDQPRALIKTVKNIEFREMKDADVCCGSAGGLYSIVHSDMSLTLVKNKLDNASNTKAEILVTANPGCQIQLEMGARFYKNIKIMHLMEYLDSKLKKR